MLKFGWILVFSITSAFQACDGGLHEEEDSFYFVDNPIGEDCNIYQMVFTEGDYSFRFALSGKCKNLTKEDLIKSYEKFLTTYSDSLIAEPNTKFILEYYDSHNMSDYDIERIISISGKKMGKTVSVIDRQKGRIVLKVHQEVGFTQRIWNDY